jgi:NAD(P)H-hydrate epimerase
MPRPLTRDEVRAIDRRAAEELGLPTLVLMENAGRGAAALVREALRLPPPARVAILCGPGNNGGDGGVVARHLDAWGYDARVLWLADPSRLAPDAAVQHGILARARVRQEAWPGAFDPEALALWLGTADAVVDGLLGTGLARPVDGRLAVAIGAVNAAGRPVLALDLPSGLDADTGTPLGVAVRADHTATFVAPKVGFAAPGADAFTGTVHVVDIGVPLCLLPG